MSRERMGPAGMDLIGKTRKHVAFCRVISARGRPVVVRLFDDRLEDTARKIASGFNQAVRDRIYTVRKLKPGDSYLRKIGEDVVDVIHGVDDGEKH